MRQCFFPLNKISLLAPLVSSLPLAFCITATLVWFFMQVFF
jgi:hypothetical protein